MPPRHGALWITVRVSLLLPFSDVLPSHVCSCFSECLTDVSASCGHRAAAHPSPSFSGTLCPEASPLSRALPRHLSLSSPLSCVPGTSLLPLSAKRHCHSIISMFMKFTALPEICHLTSMRSLACRHSAPTFPGDACPSHGSAQISASRFHFQDSNAGPYTLTSVQNHFTRAVLILYCLRAIF